MVTQNRVQLAVLVFATLCVLNSKAFAEESANEVATFGGGCCWCVEALFQRIDGVQSVLLGFMGGRTKNPTYLQVTTGRTGHVEVINSADEDHLNYFNRNKETTYCVVNIVPKLERLRKDLDDHLTYEDAE